MKSPKLLVLSLVFLTSAMYTLSAQTIFDVHVGYSPAQDIGSQDIRVNFNNGSTDGLLRPSRQSAGYTIGLGVTHDMPSGFFLKGELQYHRSKIHYEMYPIQAPNELSSAVMFYETIHTIAVPLSVGVRLGSFRVLSGVNANARIKSKTTLENLHDFSDNSSSLYMGWHASLGYDLGDFGLEVRYSQDFGNHAQGYSIGEKELTYYGNRIRWTILAKYYLGR
jgi:hypothetical protein